METTFGRLHPGAQHLTPAPTSRRLWPARPRIDTGLVSWLTTVDHKRIGLLYAFAGLFFFLVGGIEALLIRAQIAVPNNTLLSFQFYNELFTMHGTTMIFLAIMPLGSAFMNYIMPLQIGARDVAFPRLNAFAFWVFLAGAILINLGWFVRSGAPDIGWYGYAPLTSRAYADRFVGDFSTDLWIMGLQVLGVSSIVGALNFIVTIINLRAPGLTMMRLPVFTWMTLFTSFLVILSFPAITIALIELMMDRQFGTGFFEVSMGGMPILWQHLFWIFGHPEVYILILPAMGVISEVIPTFARKPLFGYPIVVFSGAVIGFYGFTVWAHHMFTTGLGSIGMAAFAVTTMIIAIPTGVKIFNWIGTLWGGQLHMRTPMLFALGFIWMFMIGGFSGVMHSAAPADTQQNDTYFVIAHFHYTLIGGTLFALLAGLAYWFPLIFGRYPIERLGKRAFWVIFAGFNLTFFPMHFLGLNGMPRRTAVYDGNMGFNAGNLASSIGAGILAIGLGLYLWTLIRSYRQGPRAQRDPWDARTLEWRVSCPPPAYNFAKIPLVHARDDFWHEKYPPQGAASRRPGPEQLTSRVARESAHLLSPTGEAPGPETTHTPEEDGIHMPDQSWWPLFTSVAIFAATLCFVLHWMPGAIAGAALIVAGAVFWAFEGPGGYHVHPEHPEKTD